jgi:hypothetical protein
MIKHSIFIKPELNGKHVPRSYVPNSNAVYAGYEGLFITLVIVNRIARNYRRSMGFQCIDCFYVGCLTFCKAMKYIQHFVLIKVSLIKVSPYGE